MSDSPTIAVVSGDAEIREELVAALSEAGFRPLVLDRLDAVLRRPDQDTHAVVTEQSAFDGIAPELIESSRRDVPCIVSVRDANVTAAVELVRRGAYSVVGHGDTSQVEIQVRQALRHRALARQNADLQRSLDVHERLAMIGKLAAGVAHELNNPLDGVLRYLGLAQSSLPENAKQVTYLREAQRGLRRMADIVRDLLQFSRNAQVEVADEDGERMARDAIEQIIELASGCGVETRYEFPPGGIAVPRAMFQVFGNLGKNAVDAMQDGGTLTVSAEIVDGRVRVHVADDGPGIAEDIQDRVFEPFFTTKDVGQGTGLGLSICVRIVERLGGSLVLESADGAGTTVTVELPLRRAAPTPQRIESHHVARPATSGKTE